MRDLIEGGLSPKTVKNVHGVLRRALNIAERQGYISRNVARLVTLRRSSTPRLSRSRSPRCTHSSTTPARTASTRCT